MEKVWEVRYKSWERRVRLTYNAYPFVPFEFVTAGTYNLSKNFIFLKKNPILPPFHLSYFSI